MDKEKILVNVSNYSDLQKHQGLALTYMYLLEAPNTPTPPSDEASSRV